MPEVNSFESAFKWFVIGVVAGFAAAAVTTYIATPAEKALGLA